MINAPSIELLHGAQSDKSYAAYLSRLESWQQKINKTSRLNWSEVLTGNDTVIGGNELFADTQLIILDNLESMTPSEKNFTAIQKLITIAGDTSHHYLGWINKKLPAKLASCWQKSPIVVLQEFIPSPLIFKFLDQLKPQLTLAQKRQLQTELDQLVTSEGAEYCLAMLGWKIRQLLSAIEPTAKLSKSKTFSKLKTQSQQFGLTKLQELHHWLLVTDIDRKNHTSAPDLTQQLRSFFWQI